MHIPDGFLSPSLTVPAWIASAPLWIYSARRHFGPRAVDALPVIGSLTALSFVVQTIMIPVPGGTSVHLAGCTLLALLQNPLVAFLCETLVLLLQALVFGIGGITTLPVNAIAIGLIGPGLAWLVWKALRRLGSGRVAVVVATYLGMQASAATAALALGLQHRLAPELLPVSLAIAGPAMLLPSLLAAGPLEAAYTLAALALLRKAKVRGVA